VPIVTLKVLVYKRREFRGAEGFRKPMLQGRTRVIVGDPARFVVLARSTQWPISLEASRKGASGASTTGAESPPRKRGRSRPPLHRRSGDSIEGGHQSGGESDPGDHEGENLCFPFYMGRQSAMVKEKE